MDNFNERPYENEKKQAIAYIESLLEDAKSKNSKDVDKLQEVLRLMNSKKYGLVWEHHAEKVRQNLKHKIPILVEDKNKKINKGNDNKYNFLLEGDNLYLLDSLLRTHRGKIDFIYIDPPYNTRSKQNEDFKYNDTFVTAADTYPHSKWLSFMEPRLRMAKDLLTQDGLIAVSIDYHEGYQLKLLMDEIFGEDHLAGELHIETASIAGPRRIAAMQGSVVKTTEFVFVYSRGNNTHVMKRLMYDGIDGFDTHYAKFYNAKTDELVSFNSFIKQTPKIVDIFKQYNMEPNVGNLDQLVRLHIKPICDWLYSDEIANNLFRPIGKYTGKESLHVGVNQINGKYIINPKNSAPITGYCYANRIGMSDDYHPRMGERAVRGNLWRGFSSDGGNLSKEGNVNFKHGKKPSRLIKQLIKSMTPGDRPVTILDFFAGSGTTGEAAMALNHEKAGHYNFILGTNNEAIDVAYQRMKNISEKYPLNLKFYDTEFLDRDSDELEQELLNNVRALVEIQNQVDLDNSDIAIVITRTEAMNLDLTGIRKVYMRSRVRRMMDAETKLKYMKAGVDLIDIPEEFFADEMEGLE